MGTPPPLSTPRPPPLRPGPGVRRLGDEEYERRVGDGAAEPGLGVGKGPFRSGVLYPRTQAFLRMGFGAAPAAVAASLRLTRAVASHIHPRVLEYTRGDTHCSSPGKTAYCRRPIAG